MNREKIWIIFYASLNGLKTLENSLAQLTTIKFGWLNAKPSWLRPEKRGSYSALDRIGAAETGETKSQASHTLSLSPLCRFSLV